MSEKRKAVKKEASVGRGGRDAGSDKVCRAFASKGECPYGEKCKFSHGDVPISKKKYGICRDFQSGKVCKYGEKCKFLHEGPSEKPDDKGSASGEAVVQKSVTSGGAVVHKLSDLFADKTIGISASHEEVLEYAETKKWPVVGLPSRSAISHPLSHVSREVALLHCARVALTGLQRARVLSIYGAARDKRVLSLNGFNKEGDKIVVSEQCSLQVDIGPNEYYPGDSGKIDGRVNPVGDYNFVVATDVYWDGVRGPVTTSTFRRWCSWSVSGECYVICRTFDGEAGADLIPDYQGPPEGVWYKTQNGMIVFSADRAVYEYPLHYAYGFLRYKCIDGLSVTFLAEFGPYVVYKIALDSPLVTEVPVYLSRQNVGVVQAKDFYRQGWYWVMMRLLNLPEVRWPRYWQQQTKSHYRLRIHMATLATLGPRFVLRQPTGNALDQATSQVIHSMESDPQMVALYGRYPREFMEIATETSLAVVYYGKNDIAQCTLAMREDQSEGEDNLLKARGVANPGSSPASACYSVLAWIGMLCFMLVFSIFIPVIVAQMPEIKLIPGVGAVEDKEVTPNWYDVDVGPYWNYVGVAVTGVASYSHSSLFIKQAQKIGDALIRNAHYVVDEVKFSWRTWKAQQRLFETLWQRWLRMPGREGVSTREAFLEWLERRKDWYPSDNEHRSGIVYLAEGDKVPAMTVKSIDPKLHRGQMHIEVAGVEMGLQEAFDVLLADDQNHVPKISHPIAITNGMLFQPDKNDVNLLHAIATRMHSEVIGDISPEGLTGKEWTTLQEKRDAMLEASWKRHGKRICKLIGPVMAEQVSIEKCAASMTGPKCRRLLAAYEDDVLGRAGKYRKNITVKWNETVALKEINGVPTVKPRCITVLSDNFHVAFAPDARGCADLFHDVFDGRVHNGIKVFFASGYTGDKLNQIGEALASVSDLIAVSGDDSVVCMARQPKSRKTLGPYAEADFKAYDQSQREACLRGHALWMREIGVGAFYIDLMLKACSMPYVARGKSVRIQGDAGYQLATGIDWTTLLNSVSNICYWFDVFDNLDVHPEEHAKNLGFNVKFKPVDDVHTLTFLKGWWLRDLENKIVWYPLPSQVVKIGKLMRDPRLFSVDKKSHSQGVLCAAYAIAQSMKTIPRSYPIMGSFLAMLDRLGVSCSHVVSASEDGWFKPDVVGLSVNRTFALSHMCMRYGVEVEDIERVECLFSGVAMLPAFIEDPLFLRLRDVDYS